MRKIIIVFCLVVGLASVTPSVGARQKSMSVQIREAQVRSAPGFLSRVLTTVPYTERVTILEEKTDWVRVQIDGSQIEGWMHSTALTAKKLKLSAGEQDAQLAVSSDEQALAGKGFNSDVEAQFKKQNSKIDFAPVDKMVKIKIPAETIQAFLTDGSVTPTTKGAQ